MNNTHKSKDRRLTVGFASVLFCLVIVSIMWPIWATITKVFASRLAAAGIAAADPALGAKYFAVFAEGALFYLLINSWIWLCLIFGLFGKTYLTSKQPFAGIWYTVVGFSVGIAALLILSLTLGTWWKPFNVGILFTPNSAEELQMAIHGWEMINFYTLGVLMIQIPAAALFHKWPFAGRMPAPLDGWAVFMSSTVITLLFWFATVIPSLADLRLGEEQILSKPFGSWTYYLAFGQAFIWWFLIPAEGGEHFPMKLFAKKQPYMGLVGLVIAFIGGLFTPIIIGKFLSITGLGANLNHDIAIATMEISLILFTLLWHHLFDDYPHESKVPNQARRVLTRISIWVIGGLIWGAFWISSYPKLPFGANDLGIGYPAAGPLAGQFALIMVLAIFNTYFDKWPIIRSKSEKKSS